MSKKRDVNKDYGIITYRVGSKKIEKDIKKLIKDTTKKLNDKAEHGVVAQSQIVSALFINFIEKVQISHVRAIKSKI